MQGIDLPPTPPINHNQFIPDPQVPAFQALGARLSGIEVSR
jgi:hypothetical protein